MELRAFVGMIYGVFLRLLITFWEEVKITAIFEEVAGCVNSLFALSRFMFCNWVSRCLSLHGFISSQSL